MKITKESLNNYFEITSTIEELESEIFDKKDEIKDIEERAWALKKKQSKIFPGDEQREQAETVFQIIADNIDEFIYKYGFEKGFILNPFYMFVEGLYGLEFEKIDPLIEKNENMKRMFKKIGLNKKVRNRIKKHHEELISMFEGKTVDEIEKTAVAIQDTLETER